MDESIQCCNRTPMKDHPRFMQMKAAAFNNVGTDYFVHGDYHQAWSLFKGALEVVLTTERITHGCLYQDNQISNGTNDTSLENVNSVGANLHEAIQSNKYIQAAESILTAVTEKNESYMFNRYNALKRFQSAYEKAITSSSKRETKVDSRYELYIHRSPFKVSVTPEWPSQSQTSPAVQWEHQLRSAKIIFNLALVEHMVDRKSENAVSLYELAVTLLANDNITEMIRIALVNNIGVWCYENDNTDAAQHCMEYLSREPTLVVVAASDSNVSSPSSVAAINSDIHSSSKFPPEILSKIVKNIHWILSPPCTTSAAA